MLGVDDHGIAAIVHLGVDNEDEDFIIFAVARAQRCAGQGLGREGMRIALDICRATNANRGLHAQVIGRIDPRNVASKGMAEAVGFVYSGFMVDGYEVWSYRLD
jgi:L-amino acid N-acyltransferase YncA